MAASAGLVTLLESLCQSLNTAFEATPKLAGISPPEHGISLLDVKNDLLLSYLQNLVFLIILKIRNAKQGAQCKSQDSSGLNDAVVKKLVELRLFLEKGVRPVEDKLRYQIEKVLRIAEDQEREAQAKEAASKADDGEESDESGSERDSQSDEAVDEEGDSEVEEDETLELAAPNRAALMRPSGGMGMAAAVTKESARGVYRPPRIAATLMPTTERRERGERKMKSATMDEFIADEFTSTPMAEPSIGTNIAARGRRIKTDSERKDEEERRKYEETNFVRLPKESKKERAKKAKAEGRSSRVNFGGEEWRGLSDGVDRINQLTKSKSRGGVRSLLDKSRKRGLETTDGPLGNGNGGIEIGERYQKRLKLQEMGRRDRGKNRR